MSILTGKTIGQLISLSAITDNTLFPVEFNNKTYHIPYLGVKNYTTGGTYSNTSKLVTFSRTDGATYVVDLSTIDTNDTFVTGGTNNNSTSDSPNASIDLLYNQDILPGTYSLPYSDVFITGYTYENNNFTLFDNSGNTYQATIDTVTGLTINGNLDISGNTNQIGNYNTTGNTNLNGSLIVQSGLTANTIYTNYIDFNQNYTGGTTQGRINWDPGTGTLNVGVGDTGTGLIDLQVGQEEVVRVYNDAGSTLQKGEIVYISGSQGNRPAVKRAIATSDGYSVTTLGMVTQNILAGAEGYVTTFGIISNLNTLGLTGGTPIWLSPTITGGYTPIKPQAPQHTVLLGYVIIVSTTVGSIFINISNGWELDEIHDVRITGPTSGDLLMYSSYSGSPVWVNTKTLLGNYTISGNTNQYGNVYISGTSLSGECALFVDGNVCIEGDLTVTGDTVQYGDVFISGDLNYLGDLNITGSTNLIGSVCIQTVASGGTACLDTSLIPSGTTDHQFQNKDGVLAHLGDLTSGEPNSKGYLYMENNLVGTTMPTGTAWQKISGTTSTIPEYLKFFTTGSSTNQLLYTYTEATGSTISYLKYAISYTVQSSGGAKRLSLALRRTTSGGTQTIVPAAMTLYTSGANLESTGSITGIVAAKYLDSFDVVISNGSGAPTFTAIVSDLSVSLFT